MKVLVFLISFITCSIPSITKRENINITSEIRKYVELQRHVCTTNSSNRGVLSALEDCEFIHFVKFSSLLQRESQCQDYYNTTLKQRGCMNLRKTRQKYINVSNCIRKQKKLFGCRGFANFFYFKQVFPYELYCKYKTSQLTHYRRLRRYSKCVEAKLGYESNLLTDLIRRHHSSWSKRSASISHIYNETLTEMKRRALKCVSFYSLFDSASFQSCADQTFSESSFNRTIYQKELHNGGWNILNCLVVNISRKTSSERLDMRLKSKIRGDIVVSKCLALSTKDRWIEAK